MKINTQFVNFNPKEELTEFIDKKMKKLDTFHGKIVGIDLYMKVENIGKGNKIVELKVRVPGNEFMVKKNDDSFEKAVSSVSNSMTRILRRENQKELKRT